ncbi:MAG: nucleotidyl transferase AbiEii/AbiGii toxin family protein [Acidobacteriota bacterium]
MSAAGTPSELAAEVRKGLESLARRRRTELQHVLSEFAIERLLFRLGQSEHRARFVLKGATLFRLWAGAEHRATWDLDLLGSGANEVQDVIAVLRDICAIHDEDGIVFDLASMSGEEIRRPDDYGGVRVRFTAHLGKARIPVQVDIGFGDAVLPPPQVAVFPTLLDHTAPEVFVYPLQAVVAEKLEALVSLGVTNSRMKDFFDLHALADANNFDLESLVDSVRATFSRRGTPLTGEEPLALTSGFLSERERDVQWRAFVKRSRLEAPVDPRELTDGLRRFLLPVLRAAVSDSMEPKHWTAGGPWRMRSEDPGA